MARKKPARAAAKRAKKATKSRPAARKTARKTAKKSARKAVKKTARKTVKKGAKKAAKKVPKKTPKKAGFLGKIVKKAAPIVKNVAKVAPKAVAAPARSAKKPNLDRPRKTVADIHGAPSTLGAVASSASAAKTGRAELKERLQKNTSVSPALTAGDIDADWQAAESAGDEAPGGDNPTPDQDVVDEIGRALGVEYEDDEELQGGDEIGERDRRRWELDPASKDDFEDEE